MSSLIKEIFSYSRSQRRGILALCFILALLVCIRIFYPFEKGYDKPDFTRYRLAIIDFERAIDSMESAQVKRRDSISKSYEVRDNYKSFPKETEHKPIISEQYIRKDTVIININSADSLDLMMLKGIGPYFADKILKYRNRLGGFYEKEQLLEVYGMDTARFENIKKNISIDTTLIVKIDINKVDFKTLSKHPYFEYHIVKAIINRRDKKKPYESINELLEIESIYPELFEMIKPYILVSSEQ